MTIFGSLITTVDIDRAVLNTLKLWLPGGYLAQTERDKVLAVGTLARPKSYANVLDDDTFPDYVLPAVLVTTDGTIGDVERGGAGVWSAWWHFVVTVVIRGPDEEDTRQAASLYAATVRRLLLQKGSLGGFASTTKWNSEVVLPVADTSDKGRNLAAGIGDFRVYVTNVVQDMAGPTSPTPDPDPDHDYGDWPEAEKVIVDVVGKPIPAPARVLAGVDEVGPWIDPDIDSSDAGEDGNGVWVDTNSDSPHVGVDGIGPWIEDA